VRFLGRGIDQETDDLGPAVAVEVVDGDRPGPHGHLAARADLPEHLPVDREGPEETGLGAAQRVAEDEKVALTVARQVPDAHVAAERLIPLGQERRRDRDLPVKQRRAVLLGGDG